VNDTEFLTALERCELPEPEFTHAAHVRAAYLYLRGYEFPIALDRMRSAIRGYTAHLGKSEKYHETITVAFLALIQQRLVERGDSGDWDGFQRANPELLQRDLLLQYYDKQELASDLARRTFVLPRSTAARAARCA